MTNNYLNSTDWFTDALTRMSKATAGMHWPPFNFKSDKTGTKYEMQFALAGFSMKDINVVVTGNVLTVSAPGLKFDSEDFWIHRGFSSKGFEKSFDLGKLLRIDRVVFVDGVLTIHLSRELPSQSTPQKLKIHSDYLNEDSDI